MLTHSQIWAAIDALAVREGLTPSSLAKRAGLDPTTFNRSKRRNPAGQLRWPSTESIAKVLGATGASIDEFLHLITKSGRLSSRVPLRALTDADQDGAATDWFDKDGHVSASGWEDFAFPTHSERSYFALEIRSLQFQPHYRHGDIIIVAQDTPLRRGDRVFVLETSGRISLALLGHKYTNYQHFLSLAGETMPPRPTEDIRLIFRIIWASQ